MTPVCKHCGRRAPGPGAEGFTPWEAEVRQDGTVRLLCPDRLARASGAAIDEGLLWAEIEALSAQDLRA